MAVNTKDKYYTPEWLVKHTVKKAVEIIGKENITDIIEPSAGDGAFIEELDKLANELGVNVGYYDLYPSHPRIVKMDYKKLIKSYKKGRLIIGNPPFGTSSSLWKAFCKKSAKIGDYIAFISPASQYKSNYYFKEGELIYSELLNDVEYRGDEEHGGKAQKVRTCLNIYKVYDREEEEDWREDKVKTQLRFGRRFKDGEEYNNLYDYYLANMTSGPRLGTLCRSDEYYATFGVSVLDERIRNKVHSILENELWKELHKMRESNSCGTFLINNTNFVECMKKLLYPTREERLEQDVKIIAPFGPEENVKRYIDCDFFIARMHTVGAIYENFDDIPTNVKSSLITVRILNKDVKDKVRSVLQNLKEYYKNEYTAATVSTMSNMFLKEYLIKHLYPTREERLEQDVQITHYSQMDEYDFYIGRWGAGGVGKICETTEHYDGYTIKILNEDKRDKITDLIKGLREYVLKNVKREGPPAINIVEVKDYLIKHLYPTREERLEQDVFITILEKRKYHTENGVYIEHEEHKNVVGDHGKYGLYEKQEYDIIIDQYYGGGKIVDDIIKSSYYLLRCKDKNTYKKILELLNSEVYKTFVKSQYDKLYYRIDGNEFRDFIKTHLYPTREERLEQDVLIHVIIKYSNGDFKEREGIREENWKDYEYFICAKGSSYGTFTKTPKYNVSWGIKILNENVRNNVEAFLKKYKENCILVNDANAPFISLDEIKEALIKHLYPQDDPQFEDFDYPEVRKPVHVERAVHGKPLIPVEYREEIVKTPKEETKVAAVALF